MDIMFPGVVIISWLGLLAGFLLGKAAQEEVAQGKRWLVWIQRLIWLCIAVIMISSFMSHTTEMILIAVIFLAIILFEHQIPIEIRQLVLAVSIIFTATDPMLLGLMGSAIFMFFLIAGISVIPRHAKKTSLLMKKMVSYAVYPLAALLIYIAMALM